MWCRNWPSRSSLLTVKIAVHVVAVGSARGPVTARLASPNGWAAPVRRGAVPVGFGDLGPGGWIPDGGTNASEGVC